MHVPILYCIARPFEIIQWTILDELFLAWSNLVW